MSLHEQLYQYTSQGGLDASSARRLWQLSGQGQVPARLWARLRLGAAALAAGLVGFGVMLWVAANWDSFTRFERFALLQGLLVVAVAGAAWTTGTRTPAAWTSSAWAPTAARSVRTAVSLLAFLTLGGLLAYFGQTYQTGADAWNLFALWAALSLPLVMSTPSDLVWAPWQIVTSLAISLWSYTYAGHGWSVGPGTFSIHAIALGLSALLTTALALHGWRSGQWWAWRLSVLTASLQALVWGVFSLMRSIVAPQYGLVLALFGITLALAWWRREVFVMSVAALALNVLLVGGWVHSRSLRQFEELLLVAGLAAVLLAGSVQLILHRIRRQEAA